MLLDLRLDLDARQPSLIVFDGLSAIERSWSGKTFRQFLVGLAPLVRRYR